MSQIATSPLVLRQRMSLLPSPLKSPVPAIDQVGGHIAEIRYRKDLEAVHKPNCHVAVCIAPENVAKAIAVEIAGPDDRPSRWTHWRNPFLKGSASRS